MTAIKTCSTKWDNGTLKKTFDKKPTQADIIGVFKGKTQWHLTYSKAFPKVSNYPAMVSWLEDQSDKPSDLELWGVVKAAYTFSDLMQWLSNGGEGLYVGNSQSDKGEPKGKEKEKRKEKEKTKEKGKQKEKTKEKDKEKESGKKEEKKSGGSKDKGKRKAVASGKNNKSGM